MITAQQLEANRRNAQLSTGPTTEEGKARSSMNARRHGLTGQISAMTEEDRIAHDAFSTAMLKDLAPEGAVETQLAQRVATDSWRLNRISAIEDNLFALGLSEHAVAVDSDEPQIHAAFAAAKTFEAEAKQLQLLSLYEQRLNRAVQKNLALLLELQSTRKAERQRALEEAKKLYYVNAKKDFRDPGRPASGEMEVNGFVFSNDQIRAAIDRDRRLRQADHFNFRRQGHEKLQVKAA